MGIHSPCLEAVLLAALVLPVRSAELRAHRPKSSSPNVLIVSASESDPRARGIERLLRERGIPAATASWELARRERSERADLILLISRESRVRSTDAEVVLRSAGPVLGCGSYGCSCFGKLYLKNGDPYT